MPCFINLYKVWQRHVYQVCGTCVSDLRPSRLEKGNNNRKHILTTVWSNTRQICNIVGIESWGVMIRSSYFRYYTQPYTRRKRDSERSPSASERARESEKSRGGGSEFPSVRSIEVRRDSDGGGGSLIHSHPERGGTVAFRWGWNPKTWRCCM